MNHDAIVIVVELAYAATLPVTSGILPFEI